MHRAAGISAFNAASMAVRVHEARQDHGAADVVPHGVGRDLYFVGCAYGDNFAVLDHDGTALDRRPRNRVHVRIKKRLWRLLSTRCGCDQHAWEQTSKHMTILRSTPRRIDEAAERECGFYH